MSPKRTARPGTPAALREDLAFAARRLLPQMFKDVATDRQIYPTLARVIRNIESELWEEDPTRALLVVMRRAVRGLPGDKYREDFPDGFTWRHVAEVLYFGSELDPNLREYSEYTDRIADESEYRLPRRTGTFSRFTLDVRQKLADELLAMEREAIERRERATEVPQDTYQPDTTLIDRPEYIDRLQAFVDAGHHVICIWGEPGTGKTTLAAQFSRTLARATPVPVVRCAPMLEAITPEAEIFRQDLALALVAEGVDPAKVDRAMWFSRLCEQLAGQPRSNAVVLDNIETDKDIDQIVRAQPKVPVFMTTQKRPTRQEIACEELGNFTESQAREFIRHHLPDEDDEDAKALAHVLGCRPLGP